MNDADSPLALAAIRARAHRTSLVIVLAAAAARGAGRRMLRRAQARTNDVALASTARAP